VRQELADGCVWSVLRPWVLLGLGVLESEHTNLKMFKGVKVNGTLTFFEERIKSSVFVICKSYVDYQRDSYMPRNVEFIEIVGKGHPSKDSRP